MRVSALMIILSLGFLACANRDTTAPADLVNPFIGTGGHGHTYPGATMPFGMVQLSPDTRLDGWDGCSGYHYSDSIVYGFSHTHLQGTGVSDYGDILFSPTNSTTRKGDVWRDRYSSHFQKENEKATAGYYSVMLDDFDLNVELTATKHVGIHRYTLQNEQDSITLFADMGHRDEILEYSFYPLSDSVIVGHRVSNAWAKKQHIYFAAHFSAPFDYKDQTFEMRVTTDSVTGLRTEEMEYVPVFPLVFPKKKDLMVKVALSGNDIDGALKNLDAEATHWDFDKYKSEAKNAWNEELSKIEITGGSQDERVKFYSALYHTFTVPNLWSDVDGRYRGSDMKIYSDTLHRQYTVFSLWDTYRATHPLYTLVQQERTRDFINSFLRMHEQKGSLPVWELAACETDCMIGYHSASVIADAWAKGLRDFDAELALRAMIHTADSAHLGKQVYAEQGYISSEYESESVSKTLEYAYDDWCIAHFAKALGNDSIYDRFIQRAQSWKNIFDPLTGHTRAKRQAAWVEPFDPAEVNFHFTEANAWQYTFHVPHDLKGMTNLFGGREKMLEKLETLFTIQSNLSGREQPDITGLIGQYAHGNEPSHHVSFIFNYLGKPSRTQELTRQILSELYSNAPDGLSGNEDCGQMSAWYVLASAGLYQMSPGNDIWTITSPVFEEVKINLENGKTFTICTKGIKAGNNYIQLCALNGKEMTTLMLIQKQIMDGGELKIVLGSKPNDEFDFEPLLSTSFISEKHITPSPVISAPAAFVDSAEVQIICPEENATIEFSMNGQQFQPYSKPFFITGPTVIEARAEVKGKSISKTVRGKYVVRDKNLRLSLAVPYDTQYAAGGPEALIDGLKGGNDYRTGEWQGWWGKNISATVDLGSERAISYAGIRCIQDIRPWIWFPRQVEFFTSTDGIHFTSAGTAVNPNSDKDYSVKVHTFGMNFNKTVRYVRIEAKNYGSIPNWHLGSGYPAWLFADEIEIR